MNDLQRSLAWYRDGLGFFVSERWEEGGRLQGVMLKAGGYQVGLSQDDFSKGRERPRAWGSASEARREERAQRGIRLTPPRF